MSLVPGKKAHFFGPLGFEAISDFGYKFSRLKPHSIRDSVQYLNDENPILGRETASIFRFKAGNFESDFSCERISTTKTLIFIKSMIL